MKPALALFRSDHCLASGLIGKGAAAGGGGGGWWKWVCGGPVRLLHTNTLSLRRPAIRTRETGEGSASGHLAPPHFWVFLAGGGGGGGGAGHGWSVTTISHTADTKSRALTTSASPSGWTGPTEAHLSRGPAPRIDTAVVGRCPPVLWARCSLPRSYGGAALHRLWHRRLGPATRRPH